MNSRQISLIFYTSIQSPTFDKISPKAQEDTSSLNDFEEESPKAHNIATQMKKKLHDLISHAETQDLSEENAVKQFLENHKKLLTTESKFGQSLFRKTEVQDNWHLKEILDHAINSDNRSRKVCVALGWLDQEGLIPKTAPQVIKDQFRHDPKFPKN